MPGVPFTSVPGNVPNMLAAPPLPYVKVIDNFSEGNALSGNNYTNSSGIANGGSTASSTWVYDSTLKIVGSSMGTRLDVSLASANPNRTTSIQGAPTDGARRLFTIVTFMYNDLPTASNATFLNLRLGATAQAQIGTTSGNLAMRDKTTTRFTGSFVLQPGTTYTVEMAIDVSSGKMQYRLWSASGVLLEDSGPQTYTLGVGVDTMNIGYVVAPNLVTHMWWGQWGYSTVDWIGPPSITAFAQFLHATQAAAVTVQQAVAATLGPLVEAALRTLKNAVATVLLVGEPSPLQVLSAASQDFEDGTVGAWVASGSNVPTLSNSTTQANTGTHSLKSTMPTGTGGLGVSPASVPITVPTIGVNVNLDVWVYVPSGGMPTVRGVINGTTAFSAISSVNDAWQHLQWSFITTSLSHTLSVYPTGATTAGQFFYIDTASVGPSLTLRPVHAVGQTLSKIEAPLRNLVNALTVLQTVSVVEAPLRKIVNAVSATRTVAEAPVRVLAAAVAATRPVPEAPARSLKANVTATRLVTETPLRLLQQAVTQVRSLVEAAVLALQNLATTNIIFRDSATGFVTSGTTVSLTIPVTAQVGDQYLVLLGEAGSSQATYTTNGYSGPTLQQWVSANNEALWIRQILPGDPGSLFTVTSSRSGAKSLSITVFGPTAGCEVAPIPVNTGANSTTTTAGSITTISAHNCIVTLSIIAGSVARGTWTNAWSATAGPQVDTGVQSSGSGQAVFYLLDQGAAGATGTLQQTVGAGASNVWSTYTVALKPGAGSFTNTLLVAVAPLRRLAQAVGARLSPSLTLVLSLRAALTKTHTLAPINPSERVSQQQVTGTVAAAVESPLKRTVQAAANTVRAATTTVGARLAAVGKTSTAVEALVGRVTNVTAKTLLVTAVEAPVLRVSQQVVTATNRTIEQSVNRTQNAVAATLLRTEAAARSVQNAVAARLSRTEAPGRALAAAVQATLLRTEVPTLRVSLQNFTQALRAQAMSAYNLLTPLAFFATSSSTATFSASNGTYVPGPGVVSPTGFQGTASGAGDGLRWISPGNVASYVPANPGEKWAGGASVSNTYGFAQSVTVFVEYFDSGGVFITGQQIASTTIGAGTTARMYGNAGTAPAGTAKAHLLIRADGSPVGYTQTVEYPTLYKTTTGLAEAVAATKSVVETPLRKITPVLAQVLVRTVAPVLTLKAAVVHAIPRTTAAVAARSNQAVRQTFRIVTTVLRSVTNLFSRINRAQDYTLFLYDPLWTVGAGQPVWTAMLSGGSGMVYNQLANSDQPIPVQVIPKFSGISPTADAVHFTLVREGADVPLQSAVVYTATWYTDVQGNFWALCTVGPSGPFIPPTDSWSEWDLYLLLGDTTNVLLGPVSVQFRA